MMRRLLATTAASCVVFATATAQTPSPQAYCDEWFQPRSRQHRACMAERTRNLKPPAPTASSPAAPPLVWPTVPPDIAEKQEKCRQIDDVKQRVLCLSGDYYLADGSPPPPSKGRWIILESRDRLDDSLTVIAAIRSAHVEISGGARANTRAYLGLICHRDQVRARLEFADDMIVTVLFAGDRAPLAYRMDRLPAVRLDATPSGQHAVTISAADALALISALKSAKDVFVRTSDFTGKAIDIEFGDPTGLDSALSEMAAKCPAATILSKRD